ncbi:MAG: ferritin-like domain-containing protein [Nocardioidaceae bacterium]
MARPVDISVTRRRLLVATALGSAAALTGCDLSSTSSPAASGPSLVTPPAVSSPDRDLVAAAQASVAVLADQVRRAGRRHPALRRRLAPLRDLHAAQASVLAAALAGSPSPSASSPSATGPASATPADVAFVVDRGPLPEVARAEAAWTADLTADADTPEDGSVARLLAVLAAGTAMTLDPLSRRPLAPTPAPDGFGGGVDLLQQTLATEHAVVYAYGVVGGRTSQSADAELFAALSAAFDAHRARRDGLEAAIRSQDSDPVPAEAAYDVAAPLTRTEVVAAASGLERAAAEQYAAVVSAAATGDRAWAVGLLSDAALRAGRFGLVAEPFFGAPDLAG